ADAGVDEHPPGTGMLDEQAAHAKRDPVARVGGNAALPQRLGHDAEHGAAVEQPASGLQRVDRPIAAEPAGFVKRSRSGHPCNLAPRLRPEPCPPAPLHPAAPLPLTLLPLPLPPPSSPSLLAPPHPPSSQSSA